MLISASAKVDHELADTLSELQKAMQNEAFNNMPEILSSSSYTFAVKLKELTSAR